MRKSWFAANEERTHDLGELEVPRRCLVVDDDEDFVLLMSEFLQMQNFQVFTARNGVEALKKIIGEDFDVIICDMQMPQLAGDMFYRAVERVKPRLCQRFVFVTGHRGKPKIHAFIRGIRGLILWKPFQMHELIAAIKNVLRKAEKAEEAEASKPEMQFA